MDRNVISINLDDIFAPQSDCLFKHENCIIGTQLAYTPSVTPYLHLANTVREQTKILYHKAKVSKHVILGYNEQKS